MPVLHFATKYDLLQTPQFSFLIKSDFNYSDSLYRKSVKLLHFL